MEGEEEKEMEEEEEFDQSEMCFGRKRGAEEEVTRSYALSRLRR